MSIYQVVSVSSGRNSRTDERIVASLLLRLNGAMCSRQMTHGMIKYLGSTSGAVIRDSEVDISHISTKLVLVEVLLDIGPLLRGLFDSSFSLSWGGVMEICSARISAEGMLNAAIVAHPHRR